jgi:2-octaprenyl-6-methoxyphenol hydroxylase
MMGSDPARIAIAGGGPIGLACALLLARRALRSIVVEARPRVEARVEAGVKAQPGAAAAGDRRLIALARGTIEVLESIGVHDLPTAPIDEVRVSSAGELGAVRLRAADFGGRPLGACVYYDRLVEALARRVEANPMIEVVQPRRVIRLQQLPQQVEVELDDGTRLSHPIVIDAEGTIERGAIGRGSSHESARRRDAGSALVAEVSVAGLPEGVAIERFTREGPLALLPVPAMAVPAMIGPLPRRSLVWCMDDTAAQRRMTLDPSAFVAELNDALGRRHGIVRGVEGRARVGLKHQWRRALRAHRVAFVGNAAQSLHPVAGQGFNLGIRDCVTLADCLADGLGPGQTGALAGLPPNPIGALARYDQRRRIDRTLIATLTGHLPGLFTSGAPGIATVRSAGLVLLGAVAPLRRQFAHLLMFGVRSE